MRGVNVDRAKARLDTDWESKWSSRIVGKAKEGILSKARQIRDRLSSPVSIEGKDRTATALEMKYP
jgi:hypothetical protein